MRKRVIEVCICLVFVLLLGIGAYQAKTVKTHEVASDLYSKEEITDAITVVKHEMDVNWKGCNLREIYYAGDETSKDYLNWATRNDADESLVLLSTFYVGNDCEDGSLEPDTTHKNWMWILVRSKDGQWKCVDWGY